MYEPEDRPRPLSRFLVPLGGLVVAVLIIAGAVLGLGLLGGDDEEPEPVVEASPTAAPTPTPPGANPSELAIGQYVTGTLNQTYGGDCSVAAVTRPPGPGTPTDGAPGQQGAVLCSQSRGERENVQAYALGRPLAEPSHWIFVELSGGAAVVTQAHEITPEFAAVPGIPWPLRPGSEVVVVSGDCLNVREGPALNQAAVDCIPDGSTITVASGPVDADGFQWWQVDGRAGWVVAEYLRYPDAR